MRNIVKHIGLVFLITALTVCHSHIASAHMPQVKFKTMTVKYNLEGKQYLENFEYDKKYEGKHFIVNPVIEKWEGGDRYLYTIHALQEFQLISVELDAESRHSVNNRIFCNGFQSWSHSREYLPSEKVKRMNLLIRPFVKNGSDLIYFRHHYCKGMLNSWTYTYVRNKEDSLLLIGSVDEYSGYTIFRYNTRKNLLTVTKDVRDLTVKHGHTAVILDIITFSGNEQTVFDHYAEAFRKHAVKTFRDNGLDGPSMMPRPANGWTSWYNYYRNITEKIIMENLSGYVKNKIQADIFQIDDGYQKGIGDWTLTNDKFPGGMRKISDSIHKAGYKSGIWLAPFVCEKKSDIYRNHKDWILRDPKGKLVKAGYNPLWSGTFYALDIYNKSFRSYLKTVFDTVYNAWNFDMVKVDFLYAACIVSRSDKTRGQVMTDGMMLLRELSGDKIILGCGVPLGPAFFLVNYCRIGSDVHLKWEQKQLKCMHVQERLSTWNAVTTTIGRRQLSGRFFQNDPDVFILRNENHHLSKEQQNSLYLVNQVFGALLFVSDNVSRYDSLTLKKYMSGFIPGEKKDVRVKIVEKDRYLVTFSVNQSKHFAAFNLTGKEWSFGIPSESSAIHSNGGGRITLLPYQSIYF